MIPSRFLLMLVTFKTKAYSNITMFGDVAIRLLKLMGHSGTVPSALSPEDIPESLRRLRAAVAAEGPSADLEIDQDDDDALEDAPVRVSLRNRALPLIELLEAAAREQVPVSWDA